MRSRSYLAVGLVLAFATSGRAQRVATCVEVRAVNLDDADAEGLTRLVVAEVDRHQSHITRERECASRLLVELVGLEGHRYLTGRINWQVPHRIEVGDDLLESVTELLTIVLHNDPVVLQQPGRETGLSGALHRLRTQANTIWELELFELGGRLDGRIFGLAGVALGYRRELDQWSLGLRIAAASRTNAFPEELAAIAIFGVAFDVRYAVTADASASFYLGAQLGLEHQWLHGPVTVLPNTSDSANSTGLQLGLRLGVELFRTTTTRLDLFALASLPLFRSRDEADEVVKTWLPTLTLGIGLGL